MSLTPTPAQLTGASFLSERRFALLGDEPRCGKTGAALLAWQRIGAPPLLVVTTASGVTVWHRAFKVWAPDQPIPLPLANKLVGLAEHFHVVIVPWSIIARPLVRQALCSRRWGLVILDESHAAKAPEAARTMACYGCGEAGIADAGDAVWCLTGTPVPNSPADLWPMLSALWPDRLEPDDSQGWPDVTDYEAFVRRYCIIHKRKVGKGFYAQWIRVIKGGKNVPELHARIAGIMLRRTQKEVGIPVPKYEMLPISISEGQRKRLEKEAPPKLKTILEAMGQKAISDLDMHFGPLRRLTGSLKIAPLAQLVSDEIEGGYGKIVIMAWHTEVIEALAEALAKHGAVAVHGSTPLKKRAELADRFQADPECRVFVGQIQACGEAIDLSAANELIFAETSFVPKDMTQAALRVTNLGKQADVRSRVAALADSIDEMVQNVVVEKMKAIRELQE